MTIPPAPPDPIPDPSPPSRPDPTVPPVPPPDIPDPPMPRPVDGTADVEDDHVSDPAHDDEEGNDWSAEGGATDEGPATALQHERTRQ